MQILHRDALTLGGFAGLREHRIVTDSRLFGQRKLPETSQGIGNFVYLADARFNPHGETGMHPHSEIDVITVMVDGRIHHAGSLEHGQNLDAGDVQVQRGGGEGFSHNEINPDATKNRLLQLWVLPEVAGEPAEYQHFTPVKGGVTRIYGNATGINHDHARTFAAATTIDIAHLSADQPLTIEGSALVYVFGGSATVSEADSSHEAVDGDLFRGEQLQVMTRGEGVSLAIIGHHWAGTMSAPCSAAGCAVYPCGSA